MIPDKKYISQGDLGCKRQQPTGEEMGNVLAHKPTESWDGTC